MKKIAQEQAREAVKLNKMPEFLPRNPLATFVNQYGEEKIVHKPPGSNLAVFRGLTTVPAKLNPAVGILIGRKIRARRLELELTLAEAAARAGMANGGWPKQVMYAIENAGPTSERRHGTRIGTLYALAYALDCLPFDLMPSLDEAMIFAQINENDFKTLTTK